MPAFILWFLGPIGRWVGLALVVAVAFGGLRTKWYFDDKASFIAAQKQEAAREITKSNTARERAVLKFDAGSLPNDGFRRD